MPFTIHKIDMTKALKQAIENLLEDIPEGKDLNVDALREAYHSHLEGRTDTQKRVDFLQDCLEDGMSKREAAKALCEHDPRVGPGTAETLVYTAFSGQYQKSQRGRRGKVTKAKPMPMPKMAPPPSPMDDEDII